MFFSQSPYDPSHTPPTFSYCSSLFSLRCSQNTPLCFTTPNILSAMLFFRMIVTFLSPDQFFSSKTHGGPHCAHISPLPTAYPTPVIPPSSSPTPFLLYLLFSFSFWIQARRALGPAALPSERRGGGAGELCTPRRAARRRRQGASGAASSAPRVSGAAAVARRRRWGSGAVGRRGGSATRSGGGVASW